MIRAWWIWSLGLVAIRVTAMGSVVDRPAVVFRVVDEDGAPVGGAKFGVYYYLGEGSDGQTDTNGLFTFRAPVTSELTCSAMKEGYFNTSGWVWNRTASRSDTPSNRYTIVLKRRQGRVPMERHDVRRALPIYDAPVGFDLAMADWVAPYGKGVVTDMVVTGHFENSESVWDKRLMIDFPGAGNGALRFAGAEPTAVTSERVLPQVAPEAGYSNHLKFVQFHRKDGNVDPRTKGVDTSRHAYVIRVRTQTNEAGRVKGANYISTLDGFGMGGMRLYVQLSYFYNADAKSRGLVPERW